MMTEKVIENLRVVQEQGCDPSTILRKHSYAIPDLDVESSGGVEKAN